MSVVVAAATHAIIDAGTPAPSVVVQAASLQADTPLPLGTSDFAVTTTFETAVL